MACQFDKKEDAIMIAKKFRHSIVILLLAALLALTACGSANDSSKPAANAANPSSSSGAGSGGTLVIAMTLANIPIPDTPPTEGGEGYRFVGYQLYDSLVEWDVSKSDKISELRSGLAESWSVSDKDPTLWTFNLRKGVKFHDGEPWNADAAIFAFDRIMNSKFQYYNEVAAANSSSYISSVESYSKVDDYTIQFKTKTPDSYLLYGMSNILYPSPKAVKESGLNFKLKPVGTGPFKFVEMVERDRLVMERNPDYWGGAPKLDRVVLRPMVEPAARLSALMAGEVQWAEVPPVDSVDNLKSKSFQIYTNPYPNSWSYVFNLKEKPFDNEGQTSAQLCD
jgi:peptide/nickel transport system substrate-binding protein